MSRFQKPTKTKKLFSPLFIVLGLLFVLFSLGVLFIQPIFASFQNNSTKQIIEQVQFEYPAKITVGEAITDLPIIPVQVSSNQWPLNDKAALYMINSGKVKQAGNIVIYGHNTLSVFGNLAKVKLGDMITITTNFNQSDVFKVDAIRVISPNDVSILMQDQNEKITLYTCNDFWGNQKLVITGKKI